MYTTLQKANSNNSSPLLHLHELPRLGELQKIIKIYESTFKYVFIFLSGRYPVVHVYSAGA